MDPGMQEVLTFLYFLIMVGPYCAYSTSTGGGFEGLHQVVGANVCCGDFGKHIISVFGRSRDNLESGEVFLLFCWLYSFKKRQGNATKSSANIGLWKSLNGERINSFFSMNLAWIQSLADARKVGDQKASVSSQKSPHRKQKTCLSCQQSRSMDIWHALSFVGQ